uniref:hypothetical protein n=1 Tax=Dialister sp. TaxID=1955814 RepID=UPI004027F890
MKDSWVVQGKERRICAANESTLSTADAVPLPHAGKACMEAASPPFFIGAMPSVSFLPWYLIRVSLAFSSIVVYNKSSECHCFFWRGILIL